MIDAIDTKILTILRSDARTSAAEVARQVGMAASAVFERIRKLEERGIVRGYAAMIEPHAAGYGLLAFVAVSAREGSGCADVGQALAMIPGVQEVHHIAGNDDYLIKIRAKDAESLGRLLRDRFKAIPGLRSTRTTVVLDTLKETPALELPGERGEPAHVGAGANGGAHGGANGHANGHAAAAPKHTNGSLNGHSAKDLRPPARQEVDSCSPTEHGTGSAHAATPTVGAPAPSTANGRLRAARLPSAKGR